MFKITEIFYSIQGEGYYQGKDAIFIRFSGCNLWDGKQATRQNNPTCGQWCDTDFRHNKTLDIDSIVLECTSLATSPSLIVLTGGEPTLQVSQNLVDTLLTSFPKATICLETNGTRPVTLKNVFITVSPKSGTKLIQTSGDELKVIVPQPSIDLLYLSSLDFNHWFFQPKDDVTNVHYILPLLKQYPKFRISLQLHKLLELP
jgi:7-carboxy-7-deazaguanine synthase